MRHIISLLMENESGALSRVANMFSARGYNIEALSVAPTEDDTVSRMTVVTTGTEEIIEQITKQLNKLVDVIKLMDLTESAHIERELMLVKVQAPNNSHELKQLIDIFRGHIVDVAGSTYTVEMTGNGQKLDAFLSQVGSQYELVEVIRSGPLGAARGDRSLHV